MTSEETQELKQPADWKGVERETAKLYAKWNKKIKCGYGCWWKVAHGFTYEPGCPEHDPEEGGKVP